ncbi:PD-(D/E)XK nuclease family protein [Candidatus Nomurabacteria bacterium]|nr:PD-(D/E)XK nuclease family protein [Candidatus Nomurabacteria bacterium]
MQKPIQKPRDSRWNYGGPNWKLSRSKIDLFVECPRCFYLDNKLGIKRPQFPAFLLNSAVDELFKKEFDIHRAKGSKHPLMEKYGVDAVPFQHEEMNTWRENFEGVQFFHEPTSMTISGAVDDIWINKKGELIVVDYKSTSKKEEITLEDKWKQGYKRQMEVYQWLLRKLGFAVCDLGYFVYANGLTDKNAFDGRLEFEVTLLPYEGNPDWVEDTIFKIKETLDEKEIPESSLECDYCSYFYGREKVE